MRFAARLAGVLLLTVGLLGCDKAQIAQLQTQVATVTINVVGTDAELFNVWDLIEDTNLDGVPDDGMVYLFCESVPVAPNAPPIMIGVEPPWHHSVRISILRADSTEFEQLTDDVYLNPDMNLSPYDDQILLGNVVQKPNLTIMVGTGTCSTTTTTSCQMDPDCPMGETCRLFRTFRWSNARQLTAVNRNVLLATSNPLTDFDAVTYSYRNGKCSESLDPGPSGFAGAPQPFTFMLGKGDTIKVEARKALAPPAELRDVVGNPLTVIEPVIVGRLQVDGINIGSLGGDSTSGPVAGDGFSFFYSSR